MRSPTRLLSFAVVVSSLAACSGAQLGNSAFPGAPSRVRSAAPGLTPTPVQPASWEESLFVSDTNGANQFPVKLFRNGTWAANGSFSNPLNAPDSLWSDQKYLYVGWNAVVGAFVGVVDEYRPNYTTPIFTYSSGFAWPAVITTQVVGNVHYVFIAGSTGNLAPATFVNEYKRDTNTVLATCYPGAGSWISITGLAVAPNGSVFVAYNDVNFHGHLVEYVSGLGGCGVVPLPITFLGAVTGMARDNAGRLLVSDLRGQSVDVIDPPYTGISGTLGSGFWYPAGISIDVNNALAFVTDLNLKQVRVLQYPSGALIYALGSANGLTQPGPAVEWANYGF